MNKFGMLVVAIFSMIICGAASAESVIDYTRYNRAVRDCVGVWTPDPANKVKDATMFNGQTQEEFDQGTQHCLQRQTEMFQQEQALSRSRQQTHMSPPPAPGAIREEEETGGAEEVRVSPFLLRKNTYMQEASTYGTKTQGRNCPEGFHWDNRESSCIRHTEVVGPSPYNVPDNVARCIPGSTREIMVKGPYGPRKVQQTCNAHHY